MAEILVRKYQAYMPCLCILERNIERVHNGRNIDETELDKQKKHRTKQRTDIDHKQKVALAVAS